MLYLSRPSTQTHPIFLLHADPHSPPPHSQKNTQPNTQIWRYHLDRWPATQTWPACPLACSLPPSLPPYLPTSLCRLPLQPPSSTEISSGLLESPKWTCTVNQPTLPYPTSPFPTNIHTPPTSPANVCHPLRCLWGLQPLQRKKKKKK